MSDGVKVTIPADRTESGEAESFHVSVDQAIDMIGQLAVNAGRERARGDPELDEADEPFVYGPLAEQVLNDAKAKIRPAYGWE